MRRFSFVAVFLVILTGISLSACSNLAYYAQAAGGHLKLMRAREPIDKLLADEALDPTLRTQLETLLSARAFAVERLALPDTKSYSTYVETGRNAVTWNVVAAEEFSLRPYIWCFPIAGCVNYRGYFARADALEYADNFRREGYDVTVGGASAYSTLGWFDDPVLDTMLRGSDTRYVGTLFHEMAHQKLYIADDSDFNEAYASFIEQEGVRLWLQERQEADRIANYEASLMRAEGFLALLGETRAELVEIYDTNNTDDAKREQKEAAFEQMRDRYEELKQSWDGYAGYDGWFRRDINNARLVSVSTYRRYIPAFEVMYEDVGEDIAALHASAKEIGSLDRAARRERMDTLLERAATGE